MIIFLSFGIYLNTKRDLELRKYNFTTGTINDFAPCNYSFCLSYSYEVRGQRHETFVKTEYFNCEDGTKGCAGKQFQVKYSIENPEISEIDLGEYNQYKLTKPSLERFFSDSTTSSSQSLK